MSFVNIFRPGRTDARPRAKASTLGFERLEARDVPATTLVDSNSAILGAGSGDAQILATTPDGRYAVFASSATDIVPGQNDTPGTRDLFWVDFETGRRSLVTNAPNDDGTGNYAFNKTITFGRRFADVEAFGFGRGTDGNDIGRPTLSDDGEFVTFVSKLNAGALDADYATKSQITTKTRTLDSDRADTTYDVFRWGRGDGRVQLASRTFPNSLEGKISNAFGRRSDALRPAISADGSKVSFVSTLNAARVFPFTATTRNNPVLDGNADDTTDLFLTDMLRIDQGLPQTTTVVTRIANPYALPTNFREFYFFEQTATMGYLSRFAPQALGVFGVPITSRDNNGVITIIGFQGQPTGVASAQGVQVDPLGRYMSNDGSTFSFLSDMNARWLFNRLYDSTAFTETAGKFDVYGFTITNVDPDNIANGRVITRVGTNFDVNTTVGVNSTLALQGGSADNAIIARNNDSVTLFTAAVASTKADAQLIPGAVVGTSVAPANMELYLREFTEGSPSPSRTVLVSAIDGSLSAAQAANGVIPPPSAGTGRLFQDPTDPNASADSKVIDPRGYQFTPDGRFVVFTDDSAYLTATPLTATSFTTQGVDTNKSADVFRRDTSVGNEIRGALTRVSESSTNLAAAAGQSINPTVTPDGRYVAYQSSAANIVQGLDKNGVSDIYVRDFQNSKNRFNVFIGKSILVSASFDGTAAGNGASSNPFIGSAGGAIARVLFSSLASNLVDQPPVAVGSSHGYVVDLPISGGGAAGSVDIVAVGGGTDASVALTGFAGAGSFQFGDRFTPFPGFTGEVRVASADVTGDGVMDIVAAPGPGGGPRVVLVDGSSGKVVRNFFAFESSFTGGLYVAAADFNNDGFADIVVGAGEGGGARVQVYGGADGKRYADFFAYETSFRGGVRVAAGDVNPGLDVSNNNTFTSLPDIVTGAGMGGGPRISAFDGATVARAFPSFSVTVGAATSSPGRNQLLTTTPARLVDFFAYEPTLRNGVNVGVGDINADGSKDIVTGAGPGGGPRVMAFDSPSLIANPDRPTVLPNLFAFDSSSRNGVRVAIRDIDGDAVGDLVVGEGAGQQSRVRTFAVGDTSILQQPVMVDDQLLFSDFGSLNGAWVG